MHSCSALRPAGSQGRGGGGPGGCPLSPCTPPCSGPGRLTSVECTTCDSGLPVALGQWWALAGDQRVARRGFGYLFLLPSCWAVVTARHDYNHLLTALPPSELHDTSSLVSLRNSDSSPRLLGLSHHQSPCSLSAPPRVPSPEPSWSPASQGVPDWNEGGTKFGSPKKGPDLSWRDKNRPPRKAGKAWTPSPGGRAG